MRTLSYTTHLEIVQQCKSKGPCGRKRTLVVDTQGRLWVADVDAANRADGSLGEALVVAILWRVGERLEKVFGDQAASAVRLQWHIRQRA